jgi:hypothetical protein
VEPVKRHEHEKQSIDLSIDADQPEPKRNKNKKLAIMLVATWVFVLIAGGAAAWLIINKGPSSDKTGSSLGTVKRVSFVAPSPKTLLPNYNRRVHNAGSRQISLYSDFSSNCVITTVTLPAVGGDAKKVAEMAVANQMYNTETTKSTADKPVSITDIASKESYSFDTVVLEQDVNSPGVAFNKQSAVLAYKQFGKQVAAISYSCPTEKWGAKKAELTKLAASFKLKVGR